MKRRGLEMDDLTLCKRITEIDNVKVSQGQHGQGPVYLWDYERQEVYNPLINSAQIFDLMVKYKHDLDMDDHFMYVKDSDIPRAILTAIVEANNG